MNTQHPPSGDIGMNQLRIYPANGRSDCNISGSDGIATLLWLISDYGPFFCQTLLLVYLTDNVIQTVTIRLFFHYDHYPVRKNVYALSHATAYAHYSLWFKCWWLKYCSVNNSLSNVNIARISSIAFAILFCASIRFDHKPAHILA